MEHFMQALKSLSFSMECESGWNTFQMFGLKHEKNIPIIKKSINQLHTACVAL